MFNQSNSNEGFQEAMRLPSGAITRLGTLALRVGSKIESLSCAPNEKMVVCSDSRGFLSAFDLTNGNCTFRVEKQGFLSRPKFTRVEGHFYCINVDRIQMRDLTTAQLTYEFAGGASWISSLALSLAEPYLAAAVPELGRVCIWKSPASNVTQRLEVAGAFSLAFSQNGKYLCMGTLNGELACWETTNWSRRWQRRFHEGRVHAVAFSSDNETVCSYGRDGLLHFVEAVDGRVLGEVRGPPAENGDIAIDFKRNIVATCGSTEKLFCHDIGTRGKVLECDAKHSNLTTLSFVPSGQLIAAGGKDGIVHIWNLAAPNSELFPAGLRKVTSVAFGETPSSVFAANQDSLIYMWNVIDGKLKRTYDGLKSPATQMAISPAKDIIAAVTPNGQLMVWNVGNANVILEVFQEVGATCVAFGRDPSAVVTGGSDGVIRTWNIENGRQLASIVGHSSLILSLDISRDNNYIVSAGGEGFDESADDKSLRIWSMANGKAIESRKVSFVTLSLAISPDSKVLASCGEEQFIRLWAMPTLKPLNILRTRQEYVVDIDFSPDGKFIVVSGSDGDIEIWDIVKGFQVKTLRGHWGAVNCVAFAPYGDSFASGSDDTTVLVWDRVVSNLS